MSEEPIGYVVRCENGSIMFSPEHKQVRKEGYSRWFYTCHPHAVRYLPEDHPIGAGLDTASIPQPVYLSPRKLGDVVRLIEEDFSRSDDY